MKGSCLCGSVTYEIDAPLGIFQYCHCSRCRKFTGSAHSANIFVPSAQFRWLSGENQIGNFDFPDTQYLTTCFCKTCGSSLPWTIKGGKYIVVTAGTLDDDPGIKPLQNIFWDSRAPWLLETCDLQKYSELPAKK